MAECEIDASLIPAEEGGSPAFKLANVIVTEPDGGISSLLLCLAQGGENDPESDAALSHIVECDPTNRGTDLCWNTTW
jgi:hypothetical protein